MANSIEKIIKIKVDTKQAEADLRKLKGDINNNDNVTIKVDIDTTDAVSGLQELQGELESLQDVEVSASIDATTESMNEMTVAAGEYGEVIGASTEVTDKFTDSSKVNTAANIAQLGATTNLNKAFAGTSRRELLLIKINAVLNNSRSQSIMKLIAEEQAMLKEIETMKEGSKELAKKEQQYNKVIKRIQSLLEKQQKEIDTYDKKLVAIAQERKAKDGLIETNKDLEESSDDLTQSLDDSINGMLAGIPIIGKYASKLGLAGTAIAAIVVALGDAITGIVPFHDWLVRVKDLALDFYQVWKGAVQLMVLYGPIGIFDDEAQAQAKKMMAAFDTLRFDRERERKAEVGHLKTIGELELAIAEGRRVAQDSENKDYKLRREALRQLYKDTQLLGNERLKQAGERLSIMLKEADLNGTLDADAVKIQEQRNEIAKIKADIANMLRGLDRIDKQIITEVNASIKVKKKPKGGKPEKEYYTVNRAVPDMPDLAEIEHAEVQVFELKKKYAEKTWQMLNRHSDMVKEMDKQVLINKLYLAAEYAGVTANLADAMVGWHDQEIAALERQGITEGKEYEAAIKRKEAASIASVIMSTGSAILGTWAGYATMGPYGTAAAAVQTAALLVTAVTQIKNITAAANGSNSLGSSGASGAAPQYNVIAENQYNPIEGLIDNTAIIAEEAKKPTKAYVVAKDVTTQQELDRAISNNATVV